MSAGSPLSTGAKLPGDLLELMGRYKDAAKEVSGELKNLRAEAREAKKSGDTVRTEELKGRIDTLTAKRDELKEQSKIEEAAKKASVQAVGQQLTGRLASKATAAVNLLSGNIGSDQLRGINDAVKGVGERLARFGIARGGAGGSFLARTTTRTGAGLIRGSVGAATAVGAVVAPIGAALAAGRVISGAIQSFTQDAIAESESTGARAESINRLFDRSLFRSDFSTAQLNQIAGAASQVAAQTISTGRNASIATRVLTALGATAPTGVGTSGLARQRSERELARRQMALTVGQQVIRQTDLQWLAQSKEAQKRLKESVFYGGWGLFGTGYYYYKDIATRGAYRKERLEEIADQLQQSKLNAITRERQVVRDRTILRPGYKAQETQFYLQLRAVEQRDIERYQSTSAF